MVCRIFENCLIQRNVLWASTNDSQMICNQSHQNVRFDPVAESWIVACMSRAGLHYSAQQQHQQQQQ